MYTIFSDKRITLPLSSSLFQEFHPEILAHLRFTTSDTESTR